MRTSRQSRPSRTERGGYTLFEMLMVQGLLVVMVAASWPMLRSPLGKSQLVSAARQIRVELVKARHTAIETGVPQQFRFQPESNVFEVVPVVAAKPRTGNSPAALSKVSVSDDQSPAMTEEDEARSRRELPDGVQFCDLHEEQAEEAAQASLEKTKARANEDVVSQEEDAAEWSTPILFYPNGRTSDATIRLKGKKDVEIAVALRGLTGIPTIGEPERHKESR